MQELKQVNHRTPTKITQDRSPECTTRNVQWETGRSEIKTNEEVYQGEHYEGYRKQPHGNWLPKGRAPPRKEHNANTTDELLLALSEIESEDNNRHPKHDNPTGWKVFTQR